MDTYTKDDYERIANAVGVSTADVLKHAIEFEEAATSYRLRIPPAKREGGPTLKLRNQRPKKSKESPELRRQRSEKPKTLSELRKKAQQVEAAARKLLLHLGVRRLDEAPDGPGDHDLFTFLASYSGSSEETVTQATARVGRLAELLEAIDAAKSLEACAYKAAQESVRYAKLLPEGHQGDIAAIGWNADMMSLFKKITGKDPGTGELEIELRGDLASILALSKTGENKAFSTKEKALQIKMVAGARNQRCLHLDHAIL
jgi:hypothetical protein